MLFILGLDLASLIPATLEVEATNASVRFSTCRYNDSDDVVANGDNNIVRNTASLIDGDNTSPHSIINLNELLASSAAAYAHKVMTIQPR